MIYPALARALASLVNAERDPGKPDALGGPQAKHHGRGGTRPYHIEWEGLTA